MRKAVLLIIAIGGVLMMSDFGQRNSPDSAGAAGGPGVSTARRVFLGQPHVGRFVVSRVAQTPKRHESHIAGLFIVPYQVTLQVKEALPPVGRALFVTNGAKGEGPEAGALGLEDWLPTTVGDECVLAFDPQLIENAKRVVYLGGGANVEQVWQSVKRFYESLRSEPGLDPAQIAVAIGKMPLPRSTFFQLVFDYDRSVYQNVSVMRALGIYLANHQIPALDRRTTVAHYLGQPSEQDPQALRDLAKGMLQLAVDLADAGQGASAGVVLQRVYGYCFDPRTNAARINRPDLNEGQLLALENLLDAPEISLNAAISRGLRSWLSQ
jgi:hypothetical protein